MKVVRPPKAKPRNLKRDYADLVMEAWDGLYPGAKESEHQEELRRLWEKEEVERKAKGRL